MPSAMAIKVRGQLGVWAVVELTLPILRKAEVYERTGKDSILVAHSQGGGPGWTAGHR